jgi:hypothetical protein
VTEQAFTVPEDVRKVINFWVIEWRKMWKQETPNRIHSREVDQGGAPDWHPEFRRWIDRGAEEGGLDHSGRRLRSPRNPDQRLRTTRAFRKLRNKNPREFEVLYRTVVKQHSIEETTLWLNDRAIRLEKPERYKDMDVQILLWSAVDKALRWW